MTFYIHIGKFFYEYVKTEKNDISRKKTNIKY